MKATFPLLAFILVILFSSCQKEISGEILPGTTPDTTTTSYLVKTYTEDITSSVIGNSVTTYDLSYDAQNRITSLVSESNTGDKSVYTYPSSNAITMELFNGGSLSIHENFFLNSYSLVDSTLQYNDESDTSTEKYIYNSAKQLTTYKEYTYTTASGAVLENVHTYTYDNNGNVLGEKDYDSEISYEYYSDLKATAIVGPNIFYLSKNLVKKTTYTYGSITATIDHTYTFDNKNRLTSEKAVYNTGDIVIRKYTYF